MCNRARKARNDAFRCSIRTAARPFPALALAAALGLLLALIPYGVPGDVSASRTPGNSAAWHLVRSEAYADVAPYNAQQLLSMYASAAGIPEGAFVATVGGVVTVGTGMAVASDLGMNMGASAADNLAALVEAADYPAWTTLTSEQQELWGSKVNYDSAKFNSLMSGLGYGSTTDGFISSGGGNFEFSDDVKDRLNQLGRIGALWMNGVGVAFKNVVDQIKDLAAINGWFPAQEVGLSFDATGIEDWPSYIPRQLNVYNANEFILVGRGKRNTSLYTYYSVQSDEPVFFIPFDNPRSTSNTDLILTSETFFKWGYDFESHYENISIDRWYNSNSASLANVGSGYVEATAITIDDSFYDVVSTNMARNALYANSISNADASKVAMYVLHGINQGSGSGGDTVDGYPDNGDGIEPDDKVYMPYPNGGIGTTTYNYHYYFDKPDKPRPENPYNPGDQTGTNPWAGETSVNIINLGDINFPELFPFSLLFDISKLFDKVEVMTGAESSSGVYDEIRIPVKFGDFIDEEIVLDLGPLHDLLLMTQPFVLLLLAAGLLFMTIEFWRTILTG